jgi:hypothetical protein
MSQTGAPAGVGIGTQSPLVFWTGDHLLAFNGSTKAGAYSPCNDSWLPVDEPVNVFAEYVVGYDRLVFPPGSNDGVYYDYKSMSWQKVSSVGAFKAQGEAAVLTGPELVIWGGGLPSASGPVTGTDAGAVYNFATNRWRAMSAAGAPPARVGMGSTAWTGSALAVWGGMIADTIAGPGGSTLECSQTPYPDCSRLGDGALYDPQADRWTPMSSTLAPSPRADHTLVWTGKRVDRKSVV